MNLTHQTRRHIATGLGRHATSLLEEVQHGDHPESECDRLREQARAASYLATYIQTYFFDPATLDSIDLDVLEQALDGYCWTLRQAGLRQAGWTRQAEIIESAVQSICKAVA